MTSNKIEVQAEGYTGDYMVKGKDCVYFFQENVNGQWSNTTLTVEVLEELLKQAQS